MGHRCNQSGIGMVEVMVALFISSVAITGLAGLQIKAIKATNDASQSTVAMWAVQDLIQRIKNNPVGAKDGEYEGQVEGSTACNIRPAKVCVPYFDGVAQVGADCNSSELAVFDLWDVVCGASTTKSVTAHAVASLSDPIITAQCSAGGCSNYTITMKWRTHDDRSIDHSVVMSVEI